MSSFFEKIVNFFNPKDEPANPVKAPEQPAKNEQPEPEPQPQNRAEAAAETEPTKAQENDTQETATAENPKNGNTADDTVSAPQVRAAVIANISAMLKPLFGKDDFKGIVLFTDGIIANLLTDDFKNQLRIKFDDSGFKSLGNGIIDISVKEPSAKAVDVYNGKVFAEILTEVATNVQSDVKARITIAHNRGSMKQSEYLLDTEKDGKTVYRIGRGEITTKYGIYRENDIVINDAETDPAADLNVCVSSSHANIEINNGKFFLRAMPGGITNNNATKIIRGEKINKLASDSMLVPLEDGDIIELGRTVMLKFEIIK